MNFKVLSFLDKFKSIFGKMGIDYPVMRNILYVKLLMDRRRVPTVLGNDKKKVSEDKNNFLRSLWVYLFMGVFLIPLIMLKSNYIMQMSLVFGIIIFMITTSLISDFSSILLDIRDKSIIGVRPVNQKTLSMAKTLHILIYMFFITVALTGPSLIASIYFQGPVFFLMFFIAIVVLDIFCITLTAFVYLLVLRFFDGEKLKDIINYIQIVLSLVIMVGYQLVGRMFRIIDIKTKFEARWWQYLLVPVWFSAPFQILKKSELSNTVIIFTAMAVIIPVISIIIYIKLMPAFERNLQKLSNNYVIHKTAKGKFREFTAKLLCQDRVERIFFQFASDMMKNEREFKLKVYPTLGYSVFFPFIFLLQLFRDTSFKEITMGKTYLFIYFCGMMLPTLVIMVQCSENYKAAWIYKALPVDDTRPVFKGTVKAFIARLFLPVYLLVAVIFAAIYGIRIIPDLMVVIVSLMIYTVLSFLLLNKTMPYSRSFGVVQQNNVGTNLLLLFILGLFAAVHYAFTFIEYGVFIYLCLALIANIILWKLAFKIAPEKLNR